MNPGLTLSYILLKQLPHCRFHKVSGAREAEIAKDLHMRGLARYADRLANRF